MAESEFQPILLKDVVDLAEDAAPPPQRLEAYRREGGYETLRRALETMSPEDVLDTVKASNLRGRGGAGFPAGVKWNFLPEQSDLPIYLCCNADESEPGTCKDRPILEQRAHLLIEGIALSSYAIGCHLAFVYIRGEYFRAIDIMRDAVEEAREAGILGPRVMDHDFALDIIVHSGAGAYICGEESAMLNSIEGRMGYPRLRPPFPAQVGVYGCPTIINNVETLASVTPIVERGAEWFRSLGTEKSTGMKIYAVSGHVARPGNYEAPMNITLRHLIYDLAGGIRDGHQLKAVIPGGSSVPILTPEALDAELTYEGIQEAGSMLGSAAVIVLDETVCMVWAARNMLHFYHDESCGQCTPCRLGTGWLLKMLDRIERGEGRPRDLEVLEDLPRQIMGLTICALGDAACMPIVSALKHFRQEFEEHIAQGGCPFEKPYLEFQ